VLRDLRLFANDAQRRAGACLDSSNDRQTKSAACNCRYNYLMYYCIMEQTNIIKKCYHFTSFKFATFSIEQPACKNKHFAFYELKVQVSFCSGLSASVRSLHVHQHYNVGGESSISSTLFLDPT
jgi:hypothetical protein